MKKITALFLMINFAYVGYSQIGGISATKLATFGTTLVNKTEIEFEPAFSFGKQSKYWNKTGDLEPIFTNPDSVNFSSEYGFRFSYGALNSLEIGLYTPFNLSVINWGLKYRLPFGDNLTYAIIAGANTPIGNSNYDRKHRNLESASSIVGGIVLSNEFSDKLSIDFNTQYQTYIQAVPEKSINDIFVNFDAGFYITEKMQTIIGVNYFYSSFENSDNNISLFTLNPGIVVERAENFAIVMSLPIDLQGKNIEKSTGFTFALCIILN